MRSRDKRFLAYLDGLRRVEMDLLEERFGKVFAGRRILEVGSGTGAQLDALERLGASVAGVDLAAGTYSAQADPRIAHYDGHNLPAADGQYGLVFSSNVLEHIAHRAAFQQELMRVLEPGGQCLHVLPNHRWRLLSMATQLAYSPVFLLTLVRRSLLDRRWALPRSPGELLAALIGPRHGEFGSNLTEPWHFHPARWRKVFRDAGWIVEREASIPIAYSGTVLLGAWLSFKTRMKLARVLGGSMTAFLLRKL